MCVYKVYSWRRQRSISVIIWAGEHRTQLLNTIQQQQKVFKKERKTELTKYTFSTFNSNRNEIH